MKWQFKNPTLGEIELVETFGSDQKIVDCARVSYHAGQNEQKTDTNKFISNLISMKHETPFEHCAASYKVKCPIFVARQWVRHRLASINELSLRYTAMDDLEFYEPDLRLKSGLSVPETIQDRYIVTAADARKKAIRLYEILLEMGVSRELARIHLPVSMLTTFYWTANLREIMHFLRLRTSNHAQYEIRLFAYAILDSLKERFPFTYQSFIASEESIKPEEYDDQIGIAQLS